MDDFLLEHCRWLVVVAVLALRLDRLRNRSLLRRADWKNWSQIPPELSRHRPVVFWDMGRPVACAQSSSHGMRLVWRPRLDRRDMRLSHDKSYLAELGRL